MKRVLCRPLSRALGPSGQAFRFGPRDDRDAEKKASLRKQRDKLLAQLCPFVAGLLAFGAVSLVGCQSAKQPGTMSHASVQIRGHTAEQIQQTATDVFREEGYALTGATPPEMVFDRPGTRRDAVKWGGWEGQGVTMRVKAALSKLDDGGYLLEADAYAVQNSDDPFFRTERRNVLLNRRPYQKLLDEVARRMK